MKYTYVLLIIISITASACLSRQSLSISEYQEIPLESPNIELVSIDAKDASFQNIGDDYIAEVLSNLALQQGFTISDQASEYRAYFKMKETTFDKDLNSYFSVWMSLDIRDAEDALVMRIILIKTSTQPIQASNYLYALLRTMIRSLSKRWV